MAKKSDKYSKREAQRRFMATLKAVVNTPPKPKKNTTSSRATKKRA